MEPSAALKAGLQHHQCGRLDQAETIYRRILARKPNHADALHLLGVVAHQRGDHAGALKHIQRAVALNPTSAAYHCNLASVHQALGQLDEAVRCCATALRLQPAYPQARLNLGVAYFAQRRFAQAEQQFREALQHRPDDPELHRNLADALREQGRVQAALASYREALRRNPDHGPSHRNLGLLLLLAGDPLAALEHCRRAAQLSPREVESHVNLGRCLRELDRFEEAMDAFTQALELDSRSLALCNHIGQAWQEMGDYPQALAWYERALEVDPDSSVAQCNLADALREMEHPEEAVARYRQILDKKPDYPEAVWGLAQALWDDGDAAGAVATYRTACRQQPELAQLHAALGNVLASAGDLDEAVVCHREALRRNPRSVAAYAGLATTLRGKLPDDDVTAIEQLVTAPWLGSGRQAALHYGLAQVYDGRGNWDRAAEHMVQANALQKAHWAERNREYDPAEHTRFVDRLVDTFNPAYFQRVRGLGLATERPVFIVGLPRSGTTLTEQILASHPRVFGAGERRFASLALQRLPAVTGRDRDPLDCLTDLDGAAIQSVAHWHLDQLRQLDDGKVERIVDKLPDNYQMLGFLVTLFPNARFIHCRRDVRDVALSCWITNFALITWAVDLEHIAHRVQEYLRLMEHWRRVLPVPMLEVDYEELVADQETVSRRLVDWLGLEWDARCLAFHQTQRLVRTASVAQVRQPIYQRSRARWKHYETMLAPLLARLALREGAAP